MESSPCLVKEIAPIADIVVVHLVSDLLVRNLQSQVTLVFICLLGSLSEISPTISVIQIFLLNRARALLLFLFCRVAPVIILHDQVDLLLDSFE